MKVTEHQILEMIRKGEGIATEFKTCRNQINRNVFETVCAFLNRHSGAILPGVRDDGSIQGINPDIVAQVCKDFVTTMNNSQKLSPPAYLSIDEVELKKKKLLHIHVPESSQVHRCNGTFFE